MRVRVFYHDRCFDGACSAALFSNFVSRDLAPGAPIAHTGLFHRADQLFDESLFDADENAIVDFKYSASERVTWWFDHHQSAFLSAADAEHFRRDTSGRKFYDVGYKSCTKFIADVLGKHFGFDSSHLERLIRWADVIDGAQFESAKSAIEMPHAAMKLTLIFESAEKNVTGAVIPLLENESFEDIVARPEYAPVFDELFERHMRSIDVIRKRAECRGGVVRFDLTGTKLAGYNKFIPYYLFPESIYTVSVLDGGFRAKISVGSNPWAASEPRCNLADLCERYGGGGHPRVGAISYGPNEFERARATAAEIVSILAGEAGLAGESGLAGEAAG